MTVFLLAGVFSQRQAAAEQIVGCWSGHLEMHESSVAIAGHIDTAARNDGELAGLFDVPALALYGIEFTIDAKQGTRVVMNAQLGRRPLSIQMERRNDALTGRWNQGGMKGTIALTRCDTPQPPRIIREDVSFRNGSVNLAGTFVRPAQGDNLPVIVWTHGSGRVTRSGGTYTRWVTLLARHGIASLIYDKRGQGQSSGDESVATLHDFAGDLLAGVAAVKSRADVDVSRIGVSGLSQGGWIAPLAASQSDDIAFVVVESASGVSADAQDLYVFGNQLRRAGLPEDVIGTASELRTRLFGFYRTGQGKEDLERDLALVVNEPWFSHAQLPAPPLKPLEKDARERFNRFRLDVVKTWASVKVPVLAVWGSDDELVPPKQSYEIIDSALKRAGNKRATLHIFDSATHTLTAGKGNRDPWRPLRITPEWPDMLCDWLRKNVIDRS